MNETGSELRGWTRRNFLKAAGVAGCAMLFPWLAYAAESDELNAKADELAASAASKQAEADEMRPSSILFKRNTTKRSSAIHRKRCP